MKVINLLYMLILGTMAVTARPIRKCHQEYHNHPAVVRFQQYIQIDTSQEDNLNKAVQFWRNQASELGLPMSVYEPRGLPICVITWEGADPGLPSIMLNSHMDVVPAEEVEWTYPPYSAYMDENGDIYGRGTQDTKDIAIQYLEAIRQLKENNVTLQRTVHITLMPDEELGSHRGMKTFVDTEDFKDLNVGFALDEGLSSANDTLFAFYEDKRPWHIEFTIFGTGAHGFTMPDDSAVDKGRRILNVVMEYREQMIKIMKSKDPFDYESYTSVNVNVIRGGTASNIIPSHITLLVDMRLSPDSIVSEVEEMVKSWMAEAGNETEVSYIRREDASGKTRLDDSNPFWLSLRDAITNMGIDVVPMVCPATTDMLFLRNLGIPAVGFTPKSNTISKIHGKDEYLNVETFLKGIDIYVEILKNLGNNLYIGC